MKHLMNTSGEEIKVECHTKFCCYLNSDLYVIIILSIKKFNFKLLLF